jgi:signal transduction histidine kinase
MEVKVRFPMKRISDTGPGISESEREAVFHRFYRADNAVTDGTGLGLAIVGDIIDRMSGKWP